MAATLESYMPYDSGPGSNVTEDGWRQMSQFWRGDGVIRNELNQFAVLGDSTGMQVKVPSGRCWIRGNYGHNTAQVTLPIAAAHATLGRRDLVILRNDFVANRIELDVLTGTPASSPTYPTLTQNTSKWEIQLAKVTVDAAATTIAAAKVQALQTFTDGACEYSVDQSFQSVPTATITRVDWDLELFPSSAVDRTGTNGINAWTLRRAGQWLIVVSIEWQSSTTGSRQAWIARTADGTTSNNRPGYSSIAPNVGSWATVQNITALDRFNKDEEIAVNVYQDSGAALQIINTYTSTRVSMYWLGG